MARYSLALDGDKCPPPKRRRRGTPKEGVALGFPLEPLAEMFTGYVEEDIQVLCNGGGGSSVGHLHGRDHEMRGLKVPL